MQISVASVKFGASSKSYYFGVGNLEVKPGDHVIVETSNGQEYGYVEKGNHEIKASELTGELKPIIRIATDADKKKLAGKTEKEKAAMAEAGKRIAKLKLDMKLVGVSYSFDDSKILFNFTSSNRVDFRELVKELAGHFHARIELRQIGERDEVKACGGCFGMCGQQVCCSRWLPDFKAVSIKMAKNQNLSLNPTKISGVCGKLLCCLEYENAHYKELAGLMPKLNSTVKTPDGNGVVMYNNLLKKEVNVKITDKDGYTIKTFTLSEIKFDSKQNAGSEKEE
ncbi:MAG: stage 0 sporulation protein [Firmicutes bacterium]|nr:stage 0 sporulation protein [Bacillota bacterium]